MKVKESQFLLVKEQLKKLTGKECFYRQKLGGINVDQIQPQEDFKELPFTWKGDLRGAYPPGLMAAPEEEIMRTHSPSGTTGTPVIIPYTQQGVGDWARMFTRYYEMARITNMDRVQIAPGYGPWTVGIGFQLGAERLGAMIVPMEPENIDEQPRMVMDMKSAVLCATLSYALFLAGEVAKGGIGERVCLKKGVIGSEHWGEKMKERIAFGPGVDLYGIYGLTEVYGSGTAINCQRQRTTHYWNNSIYIETVGPKADEALPDGRAGEIVIATPKREGAPLTRYHTRDLSRIMSGDCPCSSPYPRTDTLIGRTGDMVRVKGVNIFPSQIKELLSSAGRVSNEYQVMVDHLLGKDVLTLFVETNPSINRYALGTEIQNQLKDRTGLASVVKLVGPGELPRSEKKFIRVFDNRY